MPTIEVRNCTAVQFFYTGGINDFDRSVGRFLPGMGLMDNFVLGRHVLLPGGTGTWSPMLPGMGRNFAVFTGSNHHDKVGRMTVKVTNDAVLYVVKLDPGATAILSEQTFTSANLSAGLNPYASTWRGVVSVRPTHGVYSPPAGAHHSQVYSASIDRWRFVRPTAVLGVPRTISACTYV